MSRPVSSSPIKRHAARTALLALAIATAVAALAAPLAAGAGTPKPAPASRTVVKKAANSTLEETVLTSLQGRTLYTLSAEVHGKFICTGPCLSTWHPIVVPKSVTPLGPTPLGKVTRPDGRVQVTFKGRPLYSFGGDAKAGQANGEGIHDVGTWHAASLGKITPAPSPHPEPPTPPTNPYPY